MKKKERISRFNRENLQDSITSKTDLAMHAMKAAKRIFGIPDFRYYALADGIKAIFKRIGKGPLHPRGYKPPPSAQLTLR